MILHIRLLILLAPVFVLMPVHAQPVLADAETRATQMPDIMSLEDRAALRDRWLQTRLETVVPTLMREKGVDMWIMIAREYVEDPVVATMLNAESMHARRRTVLIFHDPGDGAPVERLTVSRYGLGGLFAPAWNPEDQPDQWARIRDIVTARDPRRIALNISSGTALADGLTASQRDDLLAALPPDYRQRIVPAEPLAVGWLETRIPAELDAYPGIVRIAHAIIAQGFSAEVVKPGTTTAKDVVWWFRERIAGLKLDTWFQPSVSIMRQGETAELDKDAVIKPGDLLWTDFGLTYLGLNTDTQHMAYVLKPGENDAPDGLKAGLAAANQIQDALTASFKTGRSGNDMLALARETALSKGLTPSIYSHPLGYHGHGAGAAIGFWDNQEPTPRGEPTLRPETAWSIELAASHAVPEWGGQTVSFRLEEDGWFDGEVFRYFDGRQTTFHLIGHDAADPAR
ncbi:MAG: M24 family metallopeptidase [Pacificimonas sp.]